MVAIPEVSASTNMPVITTDPYGLDVLASPYEFYKEVREAGPIVWIEKYGTYAVGQYESVHAVMTDFSRFSSSGGMGLPNLLTGELDMKYTSALVDVDPPQHDKVRSVTNRVFSPRQVRNMRPIFERCAIEVIEQALEKGTIDGVTDLADAYLSQAFPEAIGTPYDRLASPAISAMTMNMLGPKNSLYEEAVKAAEPYVNWYFENCNKDTVRPGSVAAELYEAEAAGQLNVGVADQLVRTIVKAGTDTTLGGISFVLKLLSENPEQYQLLREKPETLRNALDEALRMESAIHMLYRTTLGPVEFAGHELAPHTKVGMVLAAANHDPRKWEDPDTFKVERRTGGVHLAFGTGLHNCLGAPIARVESEAFLSALVERVGSITPAGPTTPKLINHLHLLKTMPLVITQA